MHQHLFFILAQNYEQTEYGLAYAMVFGLIFLGILMLCVPRPRKKALFDPEAAKGKKKKRKKKKKKK